MSHPGRQGRDELEVEALVTDRYLEWLLGGGSSSPGPSSPGPSFGPSSHDPSTADADRPETPIRLASERLRSELPRFHPSFRFEERLALRLAEAAAASRVRVAAGAEGVVIPIIRGPRDRDDAALPAPTTPAPAPAPPALATAPASLATARPRASATDLFSAASDRFDDPSAPPPARRPLLIGGAVASAALSIAGAAWVAWRRAHAAPPSGALAPTRGVD